MRPKSPQNALLTFGVAIALNSTFANVQAAGLVASNGGVADGLGWSVSVSGNLGLAAAVRHEVEENGRIGAVYVFRSLDTANGIINESVQLVAPDGTSVPTAFGESVSLSNDVGLIGDYNTTVNDQLFQGTAYVYRELATAVGTITENVKLVASDGAGGDHFGYSVSQSGNIGLIGAESDDIGDNNSQGSAYVFRNLDTATGTITENVKLTASDGAAFNYFGSSVSLFGDTGLIGADSVNNRQGAAYVFRGLDTASGFITENVKLTSSDGMFGDQFGFSVSLSSNMGLVGANSDEIEGNFAHGSAFVFRNLDTATGTITENVKLIASDGEGADNFGNSVSLSGNLGLVGAENDDVYQGSAFLFLNLDTATGTITETVKITASDGKSQDSFGTSVGLNGDLFLIGASAAGEVSSGKAYSGSVASVTTLDAGNSSKTISQISFITQEDWIIGETTDGNSITLSAGDTADVKASGKAVYIGKDAGSDNNALTLYGILEAIEVYIGSIDGNIGNTLALKTSYSAYAPTAFRLAPENFLTIDGDYRDIDQLLTYLGSTTLEVFDGGEWTAVTGQQNANLITPTYADGFTKISAVPEASTAVYGLLGAAGLLFCRRKRQVQQE